ncbi:MAG: UDP-N-acetylglucosamine 2-epimerase (non-hydrolyzing) [candidate division WOR-3 bacterium]
MRVVSVVGARPQFIKLKPIHDALRDSGHEHVIIHTGQHYDPEMSDEMFSDMNLPEPNAHLGIGPDEPARQVARMISALEAEIIKVSPDWVLVYGDTTTTMAGAIASSKLRVKTGHVEAGLRSYDPMMLEEVSRRISDRLCQVLFAPTKGAVSNLEREGLGERARLVGDVMLDAFLGFSQKASEIKFSEHIGIGKPFILATVHRAENVDDPENLAAILKGLQEAGSLMPVVFPVHPRTARRVEEHGLEGYLSAMKTIPPVSYLRNLSLLLDSDLVITDSGGLQKEAFFARKPCITLRGVTEWPETLEGGANRLLPRGDGLAKTIRFIINNPPAIPEPSEFGSGRAARLIVEVMGET